MQKVPALGSQLIATSGVHFRHPGVARMYEDVRTQRLAG